MPSLRPVWAMLVGSHSALSISTSRVVSSQPECSPPMTPAIDFDALRIGDDDHGLVERIGLAVERLHVLAVTGAAHREAALNLGEVEHVQRPSAIESHIIGDVDERADGPQADGAQTFLHPLRRRAVPNAAHETERKRGAEMRVRWREVEMDAGRAVEGARDRLRRQRLQDSEPRGGEVACDACDAGRVRAVRRHCDVDDRIVEPGPSRIGGANGRVIRQLDDPLVIVAELELRRRAEHSVRTRRRGSRRLRG